MFRVDHSITVGIVAAGVFFAACLASRPFGRAVQLVVEAAWRYVTNASG